MGAGSAPSASLGSSYPERGPSGADHLDDRAGDVHALVRQRHRRRQEGPAGAARFIAVTPESARHGRASEDGLVFIAVCAARA
jgi:hypothetical protein